MVREANYTHQAMINARLDETFALNVYGDENDKTWKNLTLNATDLISDEIGDFWYYCATSAWDWYSLVITHLEGFGTVENYNWPISALQNLLENVVHITQINQALIRANEA